MSRPHHARSDQRLHLLVGLVVCAGAVAVAISLGRILGEVGGGVDAPPWPWLATYLLVILIGERLNVKARIRSTHFAIAWTDAVILIGLAIMPSPWIVLLTALGISLSKAHRRLRPAQVAFGPAKDATTAFVAGLILAGQPSLTAAPATAVTLYALAFLAMTVVDLAFANPVLALASRTSVVERLYANWDIRLLFVVGRFVVAAAAITALQLQPPLLYALLAVALIAHLWHERWVRAREERRAWQHLAAATESFSGVDLDRVLHGAVTHGAALFSADQLEVEIWPGLDRRLVRGAETVSFDGDPAHAPADGMNVYAIAMHGYPGRRDIGALRLRFRHRVTISDREHAMLSSYAAALDTAVRNAAAYGQLGEATAAHAHAAAHDPLTGLANRRELERQLHEVLVDDTTLDCRVAVLLLDLKHFKEVNDALGHLAGDRVLVEIAERLSGAVCPNDLVCRFGGDEFAIVLRGAHRPERVEARATTVVDTLAEPVTVDGLPIVVEANAGVALALDPQDPAAASGQASREAPDYRADPASWMAEVLRRADVAMYQAKRGGRRLVCYSAVADPVDRERLALAGQLPRAVSQREFVLDFQPIVDLASGEVRGAEALARWRHPTRGELPPGTFLDLVERSSQLAEFTAAVVEDALAAVDMWRAAGFDLSVSVNLSPRSLLDAGLPRLVCDALARHGTAPHHLCLELTESLAVSQLETVDQVITQLHDIGVRLSLDDFGTGYSSLALLSRISVHELKIDRGFIQALSGAPPAQDDEPDIAEATQAEAVVRSTVQLAHTLDLSVVAEGIERQEQRRLLWRLGCAAGQGHLFSRPARAEQLLATLVTGVDGAAGTLAEPLADDRAVVRLPTARKPERGRPPGTGRPPGAGRPPASGRR